MVIVENKKKQRRKKKMDLDDADVTEAILTIKQQQILEELLEEK